MTRFDPLAPTLGRLLVTLTLGEALPAGKVLTIDIIDAHTDNPRGVVEHDRHNTPVAATVEVEPSNEVGLGPAWTN